MNTYHTKIINKKNVAQDVVLLTLARPQGFNFIAGQFIQIMIPQTEKDIIRSYSIASTPDTDDLELCIKLLDGGKGSHFFRQCRVDDKLTFRGPVGTFVISQTKNHRLFVATGAGITPLRSMILDELNKHADMPMHLLFGVRSETDIFLHDEFSALAKTHKQFTYDLTLSRPSDSWHGLRGRVTDHIPNTATNMDAYLCGSPPMVQDVRKMLIERGMDAGDVHFEVF